MTPLDRSALYVRGSTEGGKWPPTPEAVALTERFLDRYADRLEALPGTIEVLVDGDGDPALLITATKPNIKHLYIYFADDGAEKEYIIVYRQDGDVYCNQYGQPQPAIEHLEQILAEC